eukprot:m.146897 g.146897  ORF g.146897 m.146897 type:complete len:99 (+) comp14978_c0_seq7:1144-1440(+)
MIRKSKKLISFSISILTPFMAQLLVNNNKKIKYNKKPPNNLEIPFFSVSSCNSKLHHGPMKESTTIGFMFSPPGGNASFAAANMSAYVLFGNLAPIGG